MRCDLFLKIPDRLFFRRDSCSCAKVSSSTEMEILCFISRKNYYYYIKVTKYLLSTDGEYFFR